MRGTADHVMYTTSLDNAAPTRPLRNAIRIPGIAASRSIYARYWMALTVSFISPTILAQIFLEHPRYARALVDPTEHAKCGCDRANGAGTTAGSLCLKYVVDGVTSPSTALWTCLSLSVHPDWIPEPLRRSGNTELLIDAGPLANVRGTMRQRRKDSEECLELALGQLHRIRKLHLYVTCGVPQKVVQLLAQPAASPSISEL